MGTGTPRPQSPVSPVRFRRNADRLTAGQLGNLRAAFEAVYALADDRGYAHHAGIHGLPLPIGCDNAHGTPYFLPWHRAYLYFLERALRDRVQRAMLAWWDWRTGPQRPAQLPQAYRPRSVAGQPNPLSSARVSRLALEQGRRAGLRVGARTEPGDAALLPRADEVRRVLARLPGLLVCARGPARPGARLGRRPHGFDPVRRLRSDLLGAPHDGGTACGASGSCVTPGHGRHARSSTRRCRRFA
jgi:hypothetical protein